MEAMSATDAAKRMKQLEKEMYECARNLEFERAAQLRDELDQVRASIFKQGAEAPVAAPSKKKVKLLCSSVLTSDVLPYTVLASSLIGGFRKC